MVKTRSEYKREQEASQLNKISNNNEEDESFESSKDKFDTNEEYKYMDTSRDSLYHEVKSQLNELKASENESTDQIYRRVKNKIKNTSRSKSSSPSRKTKSKVTSKSQIFSKKIDIELKHRKSKEKLSWSKIFIWLSFIVIMGVFIIKWVISEKSDSITYEYVINEYKSNLPGISSDIIKTAIEKNLNRNKKRQIEQFKNPVVLILYGNATRIKEIYIKLASTLIKKELFFDASCTIFNINGLHTKYIHVIESLEKHKLILLDDLESLPYEHYLNLYSLIDDSDSSVKNCLIVLSLHDVANQTKINFMNSHSINQIELIEKHVKHLLRTRWSKIDLNNLEAFLNRLVSFVALVF